MKTALSLIGCLALLTASAWAAPLEFTTPEGWKAVTWPKNFAHLRVVLEKKDDGWKAIGLARLS